MDHLGERESQRGHERHDERRVEHRVEEVLAVAAGEDRSPLCRPQPLHDEEDPDDREGQRTDHDDTKTRHGAGEVRATPAIGPTDPDEDGGHGGNRARREIDTRRQREPATALAPRPSLCSDRGAGASGASGRN